MLRQVRSLRNGSALPDPHLLGLNSQPGLPSPAVAQTRARRSDPEAPRVTHVSSPGNSPPFHFTRTFRDRRGPNCRISAGTRGQSGSLERSRYAHVSPTCIALPLDGFMCWFQHNRCPMVRVAEKSAHRLSPRAALPPTTTAGHQLGGSGWRQCWLLHTREDLVDPTAPRPAAPRDK